MGAVLVEEVQGRGKERSRSLRDDSQKGNGSGNSKGGGRGEGHQISHQFWRGASVWSWGWRGVGLGWERRGGVGSAVGGGYVGLDGGVLGGADFGGGEVGYDSTVVQKDHAVS